jgi:hypothetical protein
MGETPSTRRLNLVDEFNELASRLVRCLNVSGLDYAFTGALAVSFYGSPRTTSDVDVMITIGANEVKILEIVDVLSCVGLEVDKRRIENATKSGYNIVTFRDKTSPYSVDLILSAEKLDKRPGKVVGLDTFLQRPEGLILAKLRMIKATFPRERVQKDEDDIRSILRFTDINIKEVRERAKQEGTLDIFDGLKL